MTAPDTSPAGPATARILCTAQIMCTARQPAGDTQTRLGFCSDTPFGGDGAVIGPSGLSVVMPNEAAAHIVVGTPVTLVFTDGAIG